MDEEQLLHLLSWRRSVRRFEPRDVPRSTIEKIMAAAGCMPSGGNSHSHRFTVLTDGPVRGGLNRELRSIYAIRRRLLRSTLLRRLFLLLVDKKTRAFLRDTTYLKRVSYLLEQYERGQDPVFYNAPVAIIVHSRNPVPTPAEDCVLAAYNIVLMAQVLGLGSCFVSLAQSAINGSRKCKILLGMRRSDRVHAVVVLGYPAVDFQRAVPRERQEATWC
jgi:nitroreductase